MVWGRSVLLPYTYYNNYFHGCFGPRRPSAVESASDVRARGQGFDTRSGNILQCLLPLIQEGQFSVFRESMYTKYWLSTCEI